MRTSHFLFDQADSSLAGGWSTADSGKSARIWIFRLTVAATLLASVVVILGAFTRLVDAGLGCPDWPGCYGHLTWPTSADEVAHAEARFPDAPVEHDKTWPEMVHRYFAGALGLLILTILVCSIQGRRQSSGIPVKLPILLTVLVIVQAAFGMWTVTLKLWPQVVTAHLLGGFATLSLLWLLVQRSGRFAWQAAGDSLRRLRNLRVWAMLALVLVVVQVALGGWTSSNYAALACPDLPTCHGEWWPAADFIQGFNFFQHVGPNYLGGLLDNHARTAIHLVHRLGAVIVTLILLALVTGLWLTRLPHARFMGAVVLMVLGLQVFLGVSNVHWALPLPIAVAHNAVGALLLLVLVTVNHRILTVRSAYGAIYD